jgi:hypothetical protein
MSEDWRIVPDSLRDREPIRRGKPPSSDLSIQILAGKTVFVKEGKNTFGSIYNLAKSHNKRARTKKTTINDQIGTLVWLEDIE